MPAKRWLTVLALAVALGCLVPPAGLVLLSVARFGPAPGVVPAELRGDAWASLLSGRSELVASLLLSLALSAAVAASSTALGFVTARFIAYHRFRAALLFLSYLPFVLSPVILGTCLLYFYIRAGLWGSLTGVFLAETVFTFGFAIVFFSAFWNPTTRALEDLVSTLGGSRLQFYRKVALPLARAPLATGLFQTFLLSWFQYGLAVVIGAGKVRTLPVLVFAYAGEANPRFAAAASVLLILPPVALLWVNRRLVAPTS